MSVHIQTPSIGTFRFYLCKKKFSISVLICLRTSFFLKLEQQLEPEPLKKPEPEPQKKGQANSLQTL